jgi:hypothetical protein
MHMLKYLHNMYNMMVEIWDMPNNSRTHQYL